jgi:hypothetical protein
MQLRHCLRILFAIFEIMVATIIWFGISASGHADNLNKGVWLIAGYIKCQYIQQYWHNNQTAAYTQ